MKNPTIAKLLTLLAMLLCGVPASAGQLVTASLKNGNYGTGTLPLPNNGVVPTAEGALYIVTEISGRSNGLINWQIGNNSQWRRTGTITFLFKAVRGSFAGGEILGDNFGFGTFNNGQGAFSVGASHVANAAGDADDRVRLGWNTWHANVWYHHNDVDIEYDRWYSVGFAWGGPSEFEVWVDQELASAQNIEGSFPWGQDGAWAPSGYNMGLGDNHQRNVDGFNSAAGVMFADIRMWDEYRNLGDTVDPNRAPAATDDAYAMNEDGWLVVAAPGVLGNDTDADGDSLTAALVAAPANGTLELNLDGSFTYEPNPGFHGSDSFSYEASDGKAASEATVTIDIASLNDDPIANPDSATTDEDTPVTVDVTANDVDPDGDPLTITSAATAVGTVSLVPGGLLFAPPEGFAGEVTVTYTVSDGQGGSAEGTVLVTVNAVADPDPFAALAGAIAGLSELNHGQRTSLLARLANAERAFASGQMDIAARMLRQAAASLARFSSSAAAQAMVTQLRALAATFD